MPQLDKFTYFTQFFWSCLFLFTFYIAICNDGDGLLGISRILKLRNQLLSHRTNNIRSKDPNSLEDILRKGFSTGLSYMYSSLFEVSQWCKAVDLLGKRRKITLISCFGEISGSRGMERNILYLIIFFLLTFSLVNFPAFCFATVQKWCLSWCAGFLFKRSCLGFIFVPMLMDLFFLGGGTSLKMEMNSSGSWGEYIQTSSEGTSTASPDAGPVPHHGNTVSDSTEGPASPVHFESDEMIGGDSVSSIQRRLLSSEPFPSAEEMGFARIQAEDLFEVKVQIIQRMEVLDPTGDWMRRGARALDSPNSATGESSLKRLYGFLEDLDRNGKTSRSFFSLSRQVALKKENLDAGIRGILLNRRNIPIMSMPIESMLLAVNSNFLVFSVSSDDMMGQSFASLVPTVAAAESAIGLAIFVITFRVRGTIAVESINSIQG
ncbi:hypothetical protein QVD17_42305 [Tagetes erecta]|uniref:H(+)-transporting two-sector ATPase n=1 Tax=Tagetes erecta TaxID=13708 RepID=A0AAD8JK56_TARER|nr:hypothetical protein QVD17_42292 [Tagetes erecta]KAK1405994.1 hypothetical protein QVD17_42305 [Tagetes erecta]